MHKKDISIGCTILSVALLLVSCESITRVVDSFSKKPPALVAVVPKPNALNSKWTLDYITGPRITFDGLYPDKKPFIVLDTVKLQVSGNTGCNNFSGSFRLQGDSIHFSQLATTMMSCGDGGRGETIFMAMLGKVSYYRISRDTLWLRFKKIDAMRFVRDTTSHP